MPLGIEGVRGADPPPGKSRRVTLGRYGVLTADGERREAALVISRIKSGREPVEKGPETATVAELAARYLREHVEVGCKESTQRMYRSVVERFIMPAYGHVAVEEVDQQHIARLHFELRDIRYQANRKLEIGVKLFNLAEEWKLRTGGNPCRFVCKYRETKRERFLTDEEFRRLGEVLDEMEAEGRLPVYPAAAIRLLMLTGCRRNEIVELSGRTWTWERESSSCATPRAVRGWCRCRPRRRGCWRSWRGIRSRRRRRVWRTASRRISWTGRRGRSSPPEAGS